LTGTWSTPPSDPASHFPQVIKGGVAVSGNSPASSVNIVATAVLLVFTLLVVPLISYFTGTSPGSLEWEALKSVAWVLLAAWVICFTLGELTGNVSQVDKVWSLLPIVYAWMVAAHGEFSPRLLLMAVLVTAWGARLTYNFSRHGAYQLRFWSGHEDYRWQVLRQKPEFQPRWKWTLFNLGFISGYQNVLILLMTLPTIVALQYSETPLGWLDLLAAVLMVLMLLIETFADQQQWRYQAAKKALIEAGQPLTGNYAKGFLDTGLWAWSRHPNYFAEQGAWIAFYLFSVAASGQWLNWSISGSILLVILFRGSSNFSEEISTGKYPEYAHYQETVPRFIPLRFR
jgi:steroid 5-alpha reductase family enzyme